MVITISGTEIQIIGDPDIIFEGNSLVNTLAAVTDKDESWQYNIDIYMPNSKMYNSIIMTRNSNMLSVNLTKQMLPINGRYVCQFRGQTEEGAVYHTEKFEIWVKDSIDLNEAYDPMPAEFYQMESQMKDILKQVQETAAETLPEINESTNGQFLTNDGVEASWASVETGLSQETADERYLQLAGGTMTGNINLNGNNLDNVNHIKAAGTYQNAGIQFNSNGTIINFVTGNSTALELSANNVNVVNHGIDNVSELNMSTNGNITRAGLVGGNVNQNNKTCVDFTTTNSVGIWAEGSERVIIDTNGISVENNKITNLADPTEDTDSVNKRYVDNAVASGSGTDGITQEQADARYVQLAGSTMTGALNMGEQQLLGVTNIVNGDTLTSNTAVSLSNGSIAFDVGGTRVMSLYGSAINAVNHRIQNVSNPQDNTDAVNKQYVDNAISGVQTNIDTVSSTVDDIIDGTEALPYLTETIGDNRYLQLSGGVLTGSLSVGNNKITMGATPTEITDVVNKGYTDGVVKVVSDEVDGIISGATPISIPIATDTKIGGIKAGTGVSISTDGTLSVVQSRSDIPMASETTLGAIKVGTGLYIENDGTLEATAGIYRDPAAGVAFVGPSESKTIMLQKAYQVLYIGYMYISSTVVDPIGTVPIYLNAGQNMTDQDTGHLTVTFAENGASFSATNLDSTVGIFIFYGGFQEKNS